MTATNMCYNFVGFGCSPPLSSESLLFLSKTQKNYFVVCFFPLKNYCISEAKSEVSADDNSSQE